ncbi:MAG: cytochrome b/b6 domain-containing protein [Firmicutes bacterium]|nr:cytochrome b/b6 domain-containing protein [Bacillota bacterium]
MIKIMELRHPLWLRLLHWSNMIAITMLCLTGFYIHAPESFRMFGSMNTARGFHFAMAYVLTIGMVLRVYMGIVTKDWHNVIYQPIKDTLKLPSMILYYTFLAKDHPYYGKYNPGQKGMYTGVLALAIVQIITGFTMYWPNTFEGFAGFMGGMLVIRMIHYIVTWIFVLMVLVHVYLDVAEGIPVLMSIFTGKIPADFHHGYHVEGEDV